MKLRSIFLGSAAAVAAFFFVGCSTPATRIKNNPTAFANYTLAQQEMIKQGKAGIGFDQEAVRLALGEPDRVRTYLTKEGTSQIWSYVNYETPDGMLLYRGWYHRHYRWADPVYPWYMGYSSRRAHEYIRVLFDRGGKVVGLEQEQGW